MSAEEPVEPGPDDDLEDRPSRSARKRAAQGLQNLGVRLVRLREVELQALSLPDELRAAIREAQRLRGPAIARQHQYIGRLMRAIDPEPIERALANRAGDLLPRGKMSR
jgi:ribosome-associated protein